MKRYLLRTPVLLAFLLLFSIPALPQKKTTKSKFTILWRQADSLASLGQPRSALKIVDQIYTEATTGKNDPQVVKAVIYRVRLSADFEENFLEKSVNVLKAEIARSSAPRKQVLQSVLAEIYHKYYEINQYRFRDRSRVTNNLPDSVGTWDLATLFGAVTKTYLVSLENPDTLKKIPIEAWEAIVEVEAFSSRPKDTLLRTAAPFYPTLYDFLAGRALGFFTSAEAVKMITGTRFQVDRTWYFSPSFPFATNRMLIPADTSSPSSFALRIFRELASFHLKDHDPRALIETELKRFAFVYEKGVMPGKDSLYLDALRQFEAVHAASPWSTSVSYALAGFLNDQGQRYQPLVSDRHKWDIRTAEETCTRAIGRFPDSDGATNCKILLKSIRERSLMLTCETAVVPDKPSLALAGWKNLDQVYFRLLKADPDTYQEKSSSLNQEDFFKFLLSLPQEKSWTQTVPDDGDHQLHRAEVPVPACGPGFRILLASGSKSFSANETHAFVPFWSTQISCISKRNEDGSYEFFILDRTSGAPLKNARAEAWEREYNYRERQYSAVKRATMESDDNGHLTLPPEENSRRAAMQYLKIYYKNDLLVTGQFYQSPVPRGTRQTFLQTFFYTDRAIYRPGQTIAFKGIVMERTGDDTRIKPNHVTRVTFMDANGRKVAEQSLTTGEFGSFSGTFIAPTGVLPGQMTIFNENGSVAVQVEEYRRPTFEVTCDPLEGNYRLGEKIRVTGKAMTYSGNAVGEGDMHYRVIRTARFPYRDFSWRWPMPVSPEVEIAHGTTTTTRDGAFAIEFTALPDPAIDPGAMPVFDYEVMADVTDLNGETQSALQMVSAGYRSLLVESDLSESIDITGDTAIKIRTTNLNGRATPATVQATLYRLRQPAQSYSARRWERPDLHVLSRDEFRKQFPDQPFDDENNPETWEKEATVFVKSLSTGHDSILRLRDEDGSGQGTIAPGTYLLVLSTPDPYGVPVEKRQISVFYDPASTAMPVNKVNWFVPLKASGNPGEKARFLVGSREDINLMYEVRLRDSLVTREQLKLNNRAAVVEIPIRESYRGNFGVNFLFVKSNRAYQNSQVVEVPHISKKLDVTIESFRSKLNPGEKERWTLQIKTPAGKSGRAEMLASMYDASLDLFKPHTWNFNLFQRISGLVPWDVDHAFSISSGRTWARAEFEGAPLYTPTLKLNWFGLGYFGGPMRYGKLRTGAADKGMRPEMMDAPMATGVPGEVNTQQESQETGMVMPDTVQAEKKTKPTMEPAPIQVRRDFRETAFFYPDLHSDSTGTVILSFTAPESLTRWKFLGLAHDKELNNSIITRELFTQKSLMVFPNAPRFVRQGDTLYFSTKIVSMADGELSGRVTLELHDGITGAKLDHLADQAAGLTLSQPFMVKKSESALVRWKLVIPADPRLSVLQYRVVADAGTVSDGEEKAIPVLTNRMLVTESLPLPVRGKGSFDFTFTKLANSSTEGDQSLKNYRLTLEFASNPAWYAIQALPDMNDRPYETADAIFTAWWSNSLAAYIANSNPKIRAVFESWKTMTPDALLSNLEKNQDLKSALLQETPWVMDAAGETARKQRLGRYFDSDNLARNLEENLRKLRQLQTPGGGWTWLPGMPDNRFITQEIVTGIGKLQHLGVTGMKTDPAFRDMVIKAVQYLDSEIRKDFEDLKRYHSASMNDNHLGNLQVQYLYARSFFMADAGSGVSDPAPAIEEAFRYYRQQAERYWGVHDRYLQGMIALALNRLGNKDVPGLILKSQTEKALHSPEMGMYWAGERGYYWYQAPVETQALMVEMFDEVGRDEVSVEELRIWLLKQKQTQDWRSPRATLEACYALLLRGTDLLTQEPDVKITVGKEKLDPARMADLKQEAGTGYFRITWSGSEIRPEMGKIRVTRSGQGIAWGAMYWQYFEDLDRITPAKTPLQLEKKVFVERNRGEGPVLVELTNDEGRITVGDKLIVRIVLKVDRDLEYVHMKDLRAGGLEPVSPAKSDRGAGDAALSGYRYQDGLGYYQAMTDQAAGFFFDYLPKGTYVFEYPLRVNATGDYSNGITTVQCLYAPEFSAHSEGIRIKFGAE